MKRRPIQEVAKMIGQAAMVAGWVNNRRDHGKIIFIDLRDRSGLLQIVFTPENQELYERAKTLRSEFVVRISGSINQRPPKLINDKIDTGRIEMLAKDLEILNEAKTPPFELAKDTISVDEELRLKYRYLDLRSLRMTKNLIKRSQVAQFFREYLIKAGFLEVETPYLTKGTPEGAREFLVPARLWPGQFYVLPQSPQQFKQLLMIAGVEKYFQIARCFRDEDQRGDRQAEFTQLDLEMSFITQADIIELIEKMFINLVETLYPHKKITQKPFPQISYQEAMDKYKTDKPDIRRDKNDPSELGFCWLVDKPMFAYSASAKKIVATHHPFTRPVKSDMEKYPDEPLKWHAYSYDFILNGFEIAGGSIRIHQKEIQEQVFKILNLSEKEIKARFGHILEAFEYGAPPHGGIAPGLDRIMAILENEPNIREVIVFPKTGDNRDLMMDAPNFVSKKALKDAHIELAKGIEAEAGFDTEMAE